MHNWKISEFLQQKMSKLSKKNKSLYEQLMKKIEEVTSCDSVEHYKNLRYNMKNSKRVHIGPFVLVFQYEPKIDTINFDDFDHHDLIYKNK